MRSAFRTLMAPSISKSRLTLVQRVGDVLVGLDLDLAFNVRLGQVGRKADRLGEDSGAGDGDRAVLGIRTRNSLLLDWIASEMASMS